MYISINIHMYAYLHLRNVLKIYSRDLKSSTMPGRISADSKESHNAREAYCINLINKKRRKNLVTIQIARSIVYIPGNFIPSRCLVVKLYPLVHVHCAATWSLQIFI